MIQRMSPRCPPRWQSAKRAAGLLRLKSVHKLARLDHRFVWHPFTQMRDWLETEPVILARGKGAVVEDVYGRKFLDGNSSIWTNLHGHNHPALNTAIRRQLQK